MKKNEKNTNESVAVENAANVIIIDDATAKLNLQVGTVFEYEGKRLEITAKRSNTEENPTTGGKTLWSGNIDGAEFTEVDVCKLRKLFGLQPRKREASAGKSMGYIILNLLQSRCQNEKHIFALVQDLREKPQRDCIKFNLSNIFTMKKMLAKFFECENLSREEIVESVCLTAVIVPFCAALISCALILG